MCVAFAIVRNVQIFVWKKSISTIQRMKFVDQQVLLLKNGVEGSEIVENARLHFKTHYSFEKNISNIRREFLRLELRHPQYEADLQKIFEIAHTCRDECVDRLNEFKQMSLQDQYDMMYRTRKQGFCAGCDVLNKEMLSLRLVADNLKSLSINAQDKEKSAQLKKETLLQRNSSLLVVDDSSELLRSQVKILQDCTVHKKRWSR